MKYLSIILLLWFSTAICGQLLLQQSAFTAEAQTDILAQLFGDSRSALSQEFLKRADLYYHGGVQEEVGHGCLSRDSAKNESQDCDNRSHEHNFDDHFDCPHCSETDQHATSDSAVVIHPKPHFSKFPDPLRWLNEQVHPAGHKHLNGKRYEKEILPWIWAAVKADPHNMAAYENGAYWLSQRLDQPEEALKLLSDGIAKNPQIASLELARAMILLRDIQDDKEANDAFLAAEAKWRRQHLDEENEKEVGGRILVCLGILAEKRGELSLAAQRYQEALPLLKVSHNVQKRLTAIKKMLDPAAMQEGWQMTNKG